MPNGYGNDWWDEYSQPRQSYIQSNADEGVSIVKPIPGEKDFVENKFGARVLDLTKGPCIPSGFANKESDRDREKRRLEESQRRMAQGIELRGNKGMVAATMKGVKAKLQKLGGRSGW